VGTVESQSYPIEIQKFFPDITVTQEACPLWVPLVENCEHESPGADYFIKKHIDNLLRKDPEIDALILGCTHYPLLKETIGEVMGGDVRLIDSARETAREVKAFAEEKGLRDEKIPGKERFEVTDSPARFFDVGRIFLQHELEDIRQVNIVEGE